MGRLAQTLGTTDTTMDTSHLENTAEDLVAHRLQKGGFFVAKPKFDLAGTDLIAFVHMKDGVKFSRAQCKGRTVDNASNVNIPADYVTKGFVIFLYLIDSTREDWLYCFFASDIESWTRNATGEYVLNIPRDSHETKFARFLVTPDRLTALRILIENAEMHGEFQHLSVAFMNVKGDSGIFSGSATSAPSGA